jgi:phospholipid/cholesterol/gamma-HCH transport system permease protein
MFVNARKEKGHLHIALEGHWDVQQLPEIKQALAKLAYGDSKAVTLDAAALQSIDTAGAWLLVHWVAQLQADKISVQLLHLPEKQKIIYQLVKNAYSDSALPSPKKSTVSPVLGVVLRLGEGTINAFNQMLLLVSFVGQIFVTLVQVLIRPKNLRFNSIVRHIDEAGLNALPIVSLIAFLTSVVLAYQGATQLKQFGAEIFTIDLVAISILREMGVLLTAIMVAGRSGSAFAAEIGVMQVNEEIDAMRTLGLNPYEILVVPRVIALIIVMPILTFAADITGLIGAGVMSYFLLDISLSQFFVRAHDAIKFWTFGVGMVKAPFFAFIIATIGCLKGLQVTGSAEKVGEMTTSAVVQAIFVVILADAIFSIVFSKLGI